MVKHMCRHLTCGASSAVRKHKDLFLRFVVGSQQLLDTLLVALPTLDAAPLQTASQPVRYNVSMYAFTPSVSICERLFRGKHIADSQ
jgi:hypothetical protein